MYSLEGPFLNQRVNTMLDAQFSFAADQNPENDRGAKLGQPLLAAHLEAEDHGDLARALQHGVERDAPAP